MSHDVEPDRAAVHQAGDAVPDGVFEQRLQYERRHLTLEHALVDRPLDQQARPEPHLLDAQKPSANDNSSAIVMLCCVLTRRVVRRNSASSRHMRRAAAASLPVSALMEFRLL